jgi:hypothetical protein
MIIVFAIILILILIEEYKRKRKYAKENTRKMG